MVNGHSRQMYVRFLSALFVHHYQMPGVMGTSQAVSFLP
jgi:hypothetical protein